MEKITIPDEIINIVRELAKTAQAQGLIHLSGKFTPPYSKWGADISFSWEAGRHGEDSNQISLTSQYYVHTTVRG